VADSEATLDYIAEKLAPAIAPADARERKAAEAWRAVVNGRLRPVGKRVVCGGERAEGLHAVQLVWMPAGPGPQA